MRFYPRFLVFILIAALALACSTGAARKNQTPLETLKAYGTAYKKKDITAMKLLLSEESLKMHEQEARAQNVTVDDIVKRETLFSENQTTAEFRNERVDGERATIEMKNSMGVWITVQFVREDGTWKIDRKGFADNILQETQQSEQKLDDIINQGRIDTNANANSNAGFDANQAINSSVNAARDFDANSIRHLNTNSNTNSQP